jgi:hypothetical protein
VLLETFEMGASGGGVLHDQCVALAEAVGAGEQRPADRAGLRDGRGGRGWLAVVRVGVAATGTGQAEGLQVAAHGLGVAFEPEGPQLGGDGLGTGHALVPALVDEVEIRVELGSAVLGFTEQFLGAGGVREPAHRLDVEVQLLRGRGAGEPAGEAFLHLGVAGAGALGQPVGSPGRGGGPGRRRGRLRDSGLGLGGGAKAVVVRGDGLLRCLAQVLPQVEPVGDLDRLRGSGADAVGVRAGPVPADRVDLGVPAQPGGERAGLAVGQHVYRPVTVHVDQDGVV